MIVSVALVQGNVRDHTVRGSFVQGQSVVAGVPNRDQSLQSRCAQCRTFILFDFVGDSTQACFLNGHPSQIHCVVDRDLSNGFDGFCPNINAGLVNQTLMSNPGRFYCTIHIGEYPIRPSALARGT